MDETRDFQDLMANPIFTETLGNIIQGIAKAHGGEDGKAAVDAGIAIEALHFALAALIEADSANKTPSDLRGAAEKSGKATLEMARTMRAMSDAYGRHMLEVLGGQMMPDKLN